ncbi:MAG TPA: hypothetical protein VFO31_27125 [Vicinamibacterales bacterium]|nr:hypothetical protein [Vicinamibacterales bacterium]
MYRNWLSARDGLPPSEWVYPTGVLRDGFEMPANYASRSVTRRRDNVGFRIARTVR